MASKKTKEKIGFKDLVTFAKAGWTPDETNALLDRLEQIGDVNDPPEANGDDGDDPEADGDDGDDPEADGDDGDDPEADGDDGDDPEADGDDIKTKLEKLKKLGNEVKLEEVAKLQAENDRLKKDLQKLQKKNRNNDFSGGEQKSLEDSLIDAFQSCFN